MNNQQRALLVKTLSALGKGGLIDVSIALATEIMDYWVDDFWDTWVHEFLRYSSQLTQRGPLP